MKRELTEKEEGALIILKSTGIDLSEAAMLAKEALILANGKLHQAHKYLITGYAVVKEQKKNGKFRKSGRRGYKHEKREQKENLTRFSLYLQTFDEKMYRFIKQKST